VGLNELEVMADAGSSVISILPSVVLSWDYTPLNVAVQSSPDGTNWTPVNGTPTLNGLTYRLTQPAGLRYRLVTQ
jgi:hypothetical protein